MCSTITETRIIDFEGRKEDFIILQAFEKDSALQQVEREALLYVAGYVAHRFRLQYPNLGVPTKSVPVTDDWLSCISRGNCIFPSEELHTVAKVMNDEFLAFHGTGLSKESKIFDKVADIVSEKTSNVLPKSVISCLVRTRTYIRLRHMNIVIRIDNSSRKKSKKMKHIANKV